MLPVIPPFIEERAIRGEKKGNLFSIALFADMAGFTAMTERLMAKGVEGAEELSDILNSHLAKIVQIIVSNNGMITTFAGDALTALFSHKEGNRVLAAAKQIWNLFTEQSASSLAVKIGIAAGEMSWAIVDSPSQSTYYFRGQAVDLATDAEAKCSPGQIVCHASALPFFENQDDFQSLTSKFSFYVPGQYEQSLPLINKGRRLKRKLVQKFQPTTVTSAPFMGEFRTVAPLFISFEAPESTEMLESFISLVLDYTNKYGGHFNLLDFGDKGATILIIFGAPTAYEDLSRRALTCVHYIRQTSPIPIRAGVTLGQVFSGMVGNRQRCTYTSLGNTINLSARLMMKAPVGSVLVDEEIAKMTRHFHLSFYSALSLKGMSEPIASFELEGRKLELHHSYTTKLVGRQKETHKLTQWLNDRENRFINVHGSAGVGKSRLIDHLMACRNKLELWLWFSCDRMNRGSLAPLKRWLANRFELRADAPPKSNLQTFKKTWSVFVLPVTRPSQKRLYERAKIHIARLLGLPYKSSYFDELSAKQRCNGLREAIVAVLKLTAAKWPLMIVIDDLQWADEETIHLFEYVLDQLKSVRIIGLRRSEKLRNSDSISFSRFVQRNLLLKPFGKRATIELIAELFGARASKELVELTFTKSQGNPFFAEQLLRYLEENKSLTISNGRINLTKVTGSIPTTISAVITSRIDRLKGKLQRLLKIAAVVGQDFSIQLLAKLLSSTNLTLELADLENEALLEPVSEIFYIFSHALIRDTVYSMQLKKTLRSLHRLVGTTMEKLYSKNLMQHSVELALHFENAGLKKRAFPYLMNAGEKAAALFQNSEALSFFDRALTCAKSGKERMTVLEAKAPVLKVIGQWQESSVLYKSLVTYAKRCKNKNMLADNSLKLGDIELAMGNIAKGINLIETAASMYDSCNNYLGQVHSLTAIGAMYINRANHEKAVSALQKALVISIEREFLDERYTIEGNLALIETQKGNFKPALRELHRLLKIVEDRGQQRKAISLNMTIAHINFDRGNIKEAERFNRAALKLSLMTGDKSSLARILANLGSVYWSKGDYLRAEACYRGDLRIAKQVGDQRAIGVACGCIGGLYMDKGDYEETINWLNKQLVITKEMNVPGDLAYVTQQLGYTYKLLHDFKKSHEFFDQSITICRTLELPFLLCFTLYYKALALCLEERYAEAQVCNDEALELRAKLGARTVMSFRIELMAIRLFAACRQKSTAELITQLESLLKSQEDDRYRAEILYEMSFLTKDESLTKKAINQYTRLCANHPDSEYEAKIKELRTGVRFL